MHENKIRNIIILGGGSAGWMCASMLANYLPKEVNVTLVESEEIGIIGVGEATIPPIIGFNRLLGLDEKSFIKSTKASFKLGIEFVNWSKIGSRYLHPFGEYGAPIGIAAFQHYLLRYNNLKSLDDIGDYNLNSVMAKNGKFQLPSNDPRSPLSSISYAYHFDAALYANSLKEYSIARGVNRIEGKVLEVIQHNENGFIKSLNLDNGKIIEGDFFIDCSGFRGILIEQTLKSGYEDWSGLLPCDCAIAVPSESDNEITPFTRATAHKAGWQWRIPLQHRIGNGIVFSSNHISSDEASDILLNNIDTKPLADPRLVKFKTGIRKNAWVKNCVAIGLSCGFLEPLESTAIHLIQKGILKLVASLSFNNMPSETIAEYNAHIRREYEGVRDFLVLHYKATEREDSEFWRFNKNNQISSSLENRINIFEKTGRISLVEGELFKEASWLAVMAGQGIRPQNFDLMALKINATELENAMNFIRNSFQNVVHKMPTHRQFIEIYK